MMSFNSLTSQYGKRNSLMSCTPRHAKTREPTFQRRRLHFIDGRFKSDTVPIKVGHLHRSSWHGICQRAGTHLARLSSRDGDFIGGNNSAVELKGVNHFGFNISDNNGMLTTIWGPNTSSPVSPRNVQNSLTMDFPTIVLRMKLLGFNAVLKQRTGFKDWDFGTTPVTEEQILRSVVPEDQLARYDAQGPNYFMDTVVAQHSPPKLYDVDPPGGDTKQNRNLPKASSPNVSIEDRFIYVVQYFIDNGFYVVIENHVSQPAEGLNDSDSTIVANDKTVWGQAWKDLVYNINVRGLVNGVGKTGIKYKDFLIVDLLNEPDALTTWTSPLRKDAQGQSMRNLQPTWDALSEYYFCAIEMVRQVSPDTMFFVEGVGSNGTRNWGDNFEDGGGSQNFFNTLLTKDYVNQVALSPHVYPPSVADSSHQNTALPSNYQKDCLDLWRSSFGTKTAPGAANEHIFPVCIGETGTKRLADQSSTEYQTSDARDEPVMDAFKAFLKDEVPQAARNKPIKSLLWWSWSNSPDSGSITAATGDVGEYSKIQFKKIEWMVDVVGLQPWYKTLP